MDAFLTALTMLSDINSIAALLIGIVAGTVLGVIPGLGPSIAIALAIPFTLSMGMGPSIALLMGLYCTSVYGGAITAIILNVPGTPASAPTAMAGYAMAKQGDADLALTVATLGSAMGGLFSMVVLMIFAPVLARFALRFGPLEMCFVALFALVCIILLDRRNLFRAIIGTLLGVLIAAIGSDPMSGENRLTFNVFALSAGVPLVPLLIGLFAITEVISGMTGQNVTATDKLPRVGIRLPPRSLWRRTAAVISKSSIIGTVLGILPGAGPTAAAFVAYSEAKRSSKDPEEFEKGNIEGVAAPESANNSVVGGSMVPTLSLGIPGDAVTALILAALVLQGVIPGPRLYSENYHLVVYILVTLFIANAGIIAVGLLGTHLWARILRVPNQLLMAGVMVFATIGTFSVNNSIFDLYIMIAAGFLGVILRITAIPITPLILGFVLGPLIELNLRQSLLVYDLSPTVLWERPIAGLFALLIIVIIAQPALVRAYQRLVSRKVASPLSKDG